MKNTNQKVLYSAGKNDEYYTPDYAVLPIIKYLNKDQIIWLPFDTDQSQFYIQLKNAGYNVIRSHISEGQDFFTYQPDQFDVIVSNPPFTNKKAIFQRCMDFNKPFALIMSITWLNDTTPINIFGDDLQLLIFKQRIRFFDGTSGNLAGQPTFKSAYFCKDFLPKQIIIDDLKPYQDQAQKKGFQDSNAILKAP